MIFLQLEGIEKKIKEAAAEKENFSKVRRRMCGLQPAPTDNEVLGKVNMSRLVGKPTMWFLNRSDTN